MDFRRSLANVHNHPFSSWHNLISVIELRAFRSKTIFFRKAECVDDHFLCLLRFLIMGVLKSKDIGEHIHVEGLEFVSQFFKVTACSCDVCSLRRD